MIKMESNELKEFVIENCTCSFFDDVIKLKILNLIIF